MGKTVDYYKVLGVSIFANPEEIKAAYIKKMKEYHPDAYQGNKKEAENISAEINQGYEILSDPKQKFVYDQKYGFDVQRERIEKEQAKQKRKEERREKRKNKNQKKSYAQEKAQAKEAKAQEEFNKANTPKDKKIKTNFFTKKIKKDTKVVHPFAKTPEEKQVRKERLILDITIIALLVIVILLILFK